MRLMLKIIFLSCSFFILSCEMPEGASTTSSRRETRHLYLDYIEVTVTVRNNLNSLPINDANVIVTYNDTTHHVLQSNNNPAIASARTNHNGVAVVRVNTWSTSHQINSNLAHHITSNKTVNIRVEQSDFVTVNTSRTYPTTHVRTDDGVDIIWLIYTAEGTATVYMSPR